MEYKNYSEYAFSSALAVHRPNGLAIWYLLCSYAYYHLDTSLLSDETYDALCKELIEQFPDVTHHHAKLIDLEALKAGTGFQMKISQYPMIVRTTAAMLARAINGGNEHGKA